MTKLASGQVAVITGGAAGIGLALAQAFVRRGVRVAIADLDAGALRAATAMLEEQGGTVIGVPTDVTDRTSIRTLREQTVAAFGRVDVVCNNAGIQHNVEPVWAVDTEAWRRMFDVNFWGVVHGLQEFVPMLLAQGSGHVINTASMSGLSTVPGLGDYGTTKHAVVALSEILRADLDVAGAVSVGVTVLCPAVVHTAMGTRALGLLSGASGSRSAVGSGPNLASVLDAHAVAEATLAGIEQGRLYVLPTPGSRERFDKRVQPIFGAFDGQ